MLVSANRLIGTPSLSMQSASSIGTIANPIVDPDTFKIIAFYLDSPLAGKDTNILDTKSIREYSRYGCVIDSIEELIGKDDVVKISKVIELNFDLIGLKVETKKGSHLGKVIDFTVTSEDFTKKGNRRSHRLQNHRERRGKSHQEKSRPRRFHSKFC